MSHPTHPPPTDIQIPLHPFHPDLHILTHPPNPIACTFCLIHHPPSPPTNSYITCSYPSCRQLRCLDCAIWDAVGVECGISHLSISEEEDERRARAREERKRREMRARKDILEEAGVGGRREEVEVRGIQREVRTTRGVPNRGVVSVSPEIMRRLEDMRARSGENMGTLREVRALVEQGADVEISISLGHFSGSRDSV